MTEVITSASNSKIKKLIALQQKSSERRESGLFVVEGRRELQHCLDAGFEADTVFVCPEIASVPLRATGRASSPRTVAAHGLVNGRGPSSGWEGCEAVLGEDARPGGNRIRVVEVTKEVYSKIACREGTEGVVAEVRYRKFGLSDLKLGKSPLVVVLESVEKPGNLGAVLRSADAAGVDAVLVCDPLTDLYNPNLIRASLGGIFTVPCVTCSSEEAIRFLKSKGIRILTAQLQDSEWYYDTDMRSGTAIVIGTEATGLTRQWREAADSHIKIPMLGALDSLNASVSAAILMFEAVRQRNG